MKSIDTGAVVTAAQRFAFALTVALWALAALASALLVWLLADAGSAGRNLADAAGFSVEIPRLWQSLALGAVVLAQIGILAGVIRAARAMFKALSASQPASAAHNARIVAAWLWALFLWSVAAGALGSLISTWHYPAGERALAIQFGSAQITTIVAALMASFLARAFALGAELWQDHREII